jgi:hypothetical protein
VTRKRNLTEIQNKERELSSLVRAGERKVALYIVGRNDGTMEEIERKC